jgi:hypothetical protein
VNAVQVRQDLFVILKVAVLRCDTDCFLGPLDTRVVFRRQLALYLRTYWLVEDQRCREDSLADRVCHHKTVSFWDLRMFTVQVYTARKAKQCQLLG